MHEILNNDWNEFFRKLIRAVVIRAVRKNGIEAIRMMIGAHEEITRSFACGIGRVRRVGSLFGKIAGWAEAAIDLICRNMMETGKGLGVGGGPEFAASFEQIKGAQDIGSDEIARP